MSAKEMLYEKIQDMTEEEARQVLDMVEQVKQPDSKEALWERLSKIPGIKVPEGGFQPFDDFEPVKGTGIPASQLLIEDRD